MTELIRRNSAGKLIPTIMVTPLTSNENRQGADYYAAGNKEVSTETALTLNRLEPVSSCLRMQDLDLLSCN